MSVLLILVQIVLFFLLPWIRNQSKQPFSEIDFTTSALWRSFVFTRNPVVRVAQAYLLVYALSHAAASFPDYSESGCISC
jgi:hypothetical protein